MQEFDERGAISNRPPLFANVRPANLKVIGTVITASDIEFVSMFEAVPAVDVSAATQVDASCRQKCDRDL